MARALVLGVVCGSVLWLSGTASAWAQSAAGMVSGTVLDTSGGAIDGATVTLTTTTGVRTTVSDRTGTFTFDAIDGRPTALTVTFEGFAAATMTLTASDRYVRIVLEPPAVTEAVTVLAPGTTLRITSAMRSETPMRDVPQSVSVISRDLIADQAMRSMADVVSYVPGVGMAQGEGHRDAPIFRGNTSTSDFLVDGLRDDTQYFRDLYNVERIEVLKGPNGMIFGRGGVGGVINRVTRQAGWMPTREVSLQGGSFGFRRLTADLGGAMSGSVAARLTGMYENSDSYRDSVGLERFGVNPTVAFALTPRTTLSAGYELFHDERTTDRGIPSFEGRPLDVGRGTFFGRPDLDPATITVNAATSTFDHRISERATLTNRIRYADYDKFYENLVPGAVNAARTTVALTGYNSRTDRQNLFNQTDLNVTQRTGGIEHRLVAGVELGRQVTDNLRRTAYFDSVSPTTTSIAVPLSAPTTTQSIAFRAAATDADNHGVATVAAMYAQDQIVFSPRVEAIVGVRYDRFDVDLRNNRTGDELSSEDNLLSPRVALVVKPVPAVSLYGSYSRSYLPRAGEQLASLSATNRALDPETFRNTEVGAKWELTRMLSLTAALYRLDRGNVVAPDPSNPTLSLLVDAERTTGLEVEIAGNPMDRWSLHGGYAYQDSEVRHTLSATIVKGARLGQVPRHTFSLWNRYEVSRLLGIGLGIVSRGDSFVAADNTVILPGAARVDAAGFFTLAPRVRAQVNVENLLDTRYHWTAHNNNNILPGSPRAVRVTLTTSF
jgi:catecholate siderophore receptor